MNAAFSQPGREEIIQYKIKSVTKTYLMGKPAQKIEEKNYYTRKGDDSLEYYCGKISFTFKSFTDSKGTITKLEKYDAENAMDEVHLYKYNKDGSYSIEIAGHSAGTILQSEYDRNNKCLREIYSGTDTLQFSYNDKGKLDKIFYYTKGEEPEQIGSIIYGSKGLAERAESLPEEKARYFKYNNKGLVSEMKTVTKGKTDNTFFYSYEFWE